MVLTIIDKETGYGIPGANLFSADEYGNNDFSGIGASADNDGNIVMPSSSVDFWGISAVGFKSAVISAYSIPSTVSLDPTNTELDTVVITAQANQPKANTAPAAPPANYTPFIIAAAVFVIAIAVAVYYSTTLK